MKKNVLKLLALCLATLILQNCSKSNLQPVPDQRADAITNTTGLQLNGIGSTGLYQFIAPNGGSAGVANKSAMPGNTFNFTTFNWSIFQKWQITQVSANGYSIRNAGSNLYIQAYNYNGRQVLVQGPYTGTNAQIWHISPSGKGYKVTNKANGLAITASTNAFYQLQAFTNRPTQVWGYNKLSDIVPPETDKIVVLTFDDASKSHYSIVGPLLKKYGFGGTFYVCEFPPDFANNKKFMNWAQIQSLHKQGFEIGNHTWRHKHLNTLTQEQLKEEISYIERKCDSLDITKPTTFAYPGYVTTRTAPALLKEMGYTTARIGGNIPYDPAKHTPYYMPSVDMVRDNRQEVYAALAKAGNGKIIIFTIHGVPDTAHGFVSTPPEIFEEYLKYMSDNHYRVISMRELEEIQTKNK